MGGIARLMTGTATVLALAAAASAQTQTAQIACQGQYSGLSATIEGTREQAIYDPINEAYVRFSGRIVAGGIEGRMAYEGYTTVELKGSIESQYGTTAIAVAEFTSEGRMTVYDGQPTLRAPAVLGEFTCSAH